MAPSLNAPPKPLFKDTLKHWRKTHRLYQKEAADKLDVSVATIRKWENGKRTPRKLAMAEIERRLQ